MDPSEVEMWSDPISIWTLLEDRRSIYLRCLASEGVVKAMQTTIQRLELEKQMMRRKLGYGPTA